MQTNNYNFPIKQLKYSQYTSYDEYNQMYNKHYREDITYQFAIGSQVRIDQQTTTYTTHTIDIPNTGWDWFKKVVIEFCPQLNFGWITPTYKELKCKQKVVNNNTYYNVIPIDPTKKYKDRYPITEIKWLTTMPYTLDEKLNAEHNVYKLKDNIGYCWYSPKQLAQIAIYKSFQDDE